MEQNSKSNIFVLDINKIRARAKSHILDGAIVSDDKDFVQRTVKLLNEALATEIVCTLRYTAHYFLAEGIHAEAVKNEFKEHAEEERAHSYWIAKRIRQLNGVPDFNPVGLDLRAHSEFSTGDTLVELITEDLEAERIAIEVYRDIIQYFGDKDPTSRRLMEKILENEETHAEELSDMLKTLDPAKPGQG